MTPGWKFETTHTWIPCLYLQKQRRRLPKHVSNGLMINLSILCYEMFRRIWQFICKILILMVASIWSSNSDVTLTCWRIIHFNFLLTAAIFASICFCRASGLAFLLSLNFLFTRGYYISTRGEIFHIIAIFFNSIYRAEVSTRNENLHIISP